MSLLWRVALVNAAVLLLAVVALVLSPATVSARVSTAELVVLVAGATALLGVNLIALRRVFAPLRELTALMRRVDPKRPGRRIDLHRSVAEVAELQDAFNEMLDRLEEERRTSGRRALDAQERERRRLARELHDELGQTLTGVVLLLEGLAARGAAAAAPVGRRAASPPRARRSRRRARSRAGCGRRRSTSSGCAAR